MDKCEALGEQLEELKLEIRELRTFVYELDGRLICSCGHRLSNHVGVDDEGGCTANGILEFGTCTAIVQAVEPRFCKCKIFELRKLSESK